MGKSATSSLGQFWQLELSVRATCACGHQRIISPDFLLKRLSAETKLYPFVLEEFAKQLRCAACDAKAPRLEVGRFS